MPNVFDVLSRDHEEVRQILAKLEKQRPEPDASDKQLTQRKKIAEKLIAEESRHEAVEEMFFWPAVRDKLPDGDKLADQAIRQEQKALEVLDKLDKLDAANPQFEKLLSRLAAAGREHMEFEETRVWPQMRTALSKKEASEIGAQLEEGKKEAPARPVAETPPHPGVLKSTGPAAAASGRARGTTTGQARGTTTGRARGTSTGQARGTATGRQARGAAASRGDGKRTDTSGKTRAELYEEARRLGIEGRSSMNKEELARRVAQAH
jgi:hemerythrin-like domain-containing protein